MITKNKIVALSIALLCSANAVRAMDTKHATTEFFIEGKRYSFDGKKIAPIDDAKNNHSLHYNASTKEWSREKVDSFMERGALGLGMAGVPASVFLATYSLGSKNGITGLLPCIGGAVAAAGVMSMGATKLDPISRGGATVVTVFTTCVAGFFGYVLSMSK
jgi:hypothetical protein